MVVKVTNREDTCPCSPPPFSICKTGLLAVATSLEMTCTTRPESHEERGSSRKPRGRAPVCRPSRHPLAHVSCLEFGSRGPRGALGREGRCLVREDGLGAGAGAEGAASLWPSLVPLPAPGPTRKEAVPVQPAPPWLSREMLILSCINCACLGAAAGDRLCRVPWVESTPFLRVSVLPATLGACVWAGASLP